MAASACAYSPATAMAAKRATPQVRSPAGVTDFRCGLRLLPPDAPKECFGERLVRLEACQPSGPTVNKSCSARTDTSPGSNELIAARLTRSTPNYRRFP